MNGFQQEGFGQMDMTVTSCSQQLSVRISLRSSHPQLRPDGKRASTWECYLRPLMYPKNSEAAGKYCEKVMRGQTCATVLRRL